MEVITPEYTNLPQRILAIYKDCTSEEQGYLRQILEELSIYGTSDTYDNLWLSDYKEIPVDIDTFLSSDTYLGRTNRNGQSVYPFWRKALHEIFNAGNKFNEVVFTGATRIGKTSTAISGVGYMLYRLMCLRNPQEFYGKKDVSQFSLLFFNITRDLARGVAFREFNDTLKGSPWFNAHGRFSRSEENFYYIPEGGKISIDYGSSGSHGLGKQVFCLAGSTEILTDAGIRKLADLNGRTVKVGQWSPNSKSIKYTEAQILLTKHVNKLTHMVFNNGETLIGTPNHRIMSRTGDYLPLNCFESDEAVPVVSDAIKFSLFAKIKQVQTVSYPYEFPVYDVIDAKPYHNFLVFNHNNFLVSHNCAIMDECFVGSTPIFTSDGVKTLEEVHNQHIYVNQYSKSKDSVLFVPATVQRTKYVTDTIEIELEDGTIFEGTPEHPVMLADGTYRQLKDLTEEDDIKCVEPIKII